MHDPITPFADRLGRQTIEQLPALNTLITNSNDSEKPLIVVYRPIIEEIAEAVRQAASIDRETARKLIDVIDVVAGSVERHAQGRGDRSGVAKDQLGPVDELFAKLFVLADLPYPRGNHITYWGVLFEGDQLTYTGTPGEVSFGDAVRGLDREQRANALATLASIINGEVAIRSAEGIERIRAAAEREDDIRERLLKLWRREGTGERHLQVRTFTAEMRTSLVAYKVGDTFYEGPNAANVAGQVLFDLALGIYDARYRDQVVVERMRHMDSLDRQLVEDALQRPTSLMSRALDEIPLTALELASYSPVLVAKHLARVPEQILQMLDAIVELAACSGRIWGTHQSQIVTYLEKADRAIPTEELAALAVPPTRGVGGHSHGQTEALMRMRARDGVIKALKDGLGLIRNAA
jgi:Domain of unknown function (DUF1864)